MTEPRARLRVVCRGAVQGVGFRPAVYRLATALGLGGFVRNGPEGVVIEAEGARTATDEFVARLPHALPPLARLDDHEVTVVTPCGDDTFRVGDSEAGQRRRALVPADAALCADCRADMERSGDRRHRYAFTTCSNCGPRFSLVHALPYDRERTSMACFPLCPECDREYRDPRDRRFHAEPVCCPECGPRLWATNGLGTEIATGDEALRAARAALGSGHIVAIKSLGGFQLACRADDEQACWSLRLRKRRRAKPFALMVRDLATARRLVSLTQADIELLTGPRAPIVLAVRLPGIRIANEVAPGLRDLGVMLPTTPLHVEIFRDLPCDALVMTSGNLSEEPICRTNRDALLRLGGVADVFLLHDRDVVRRIDDSVVRSTDDGPVLMRRARGFVPDPVPLPVATPEPILAIGAHLQVTACLAVGDEAFPSAHVGDLDSVPARAFLEEVVGELCAFLEVTPAIVAVDCHPDYPSTAVGERLAAQTGARLLRVPHHLAHVAAVAAEHAMFPAPGERIAGIALDGTGYGADGGAWGGEWLLLGGDLGWERVGHLEALPLLGGERAVREPWRVAVAALAHGGTARLLGRLPIATLVDAARIDQAIALAHQPDWPRATGAGRVFEAAGALCGLAVSNDYEGEAACRLEALATTASAPAWEEVTLPATGTVLPTAALLVSLAERLAAGEDLGRSAAGFHASFCRLAGELAQRTFGDRTRTIALGGGCFANRLLLAGLGDELRGRGYHVLSPRHLPPGDGGIAYGQASLATVAVARRCEPRLLGDLSCV